MAFPDPNHKSTSSSLSSQKFDLDENDSRDILVYRVRHGYSISTQRDLCRELDKSPTNLRCSRKPIPRGQSRVHIETRDLWTCQERANFEHFPNARNSVASVGLPRSVYWRRLLMGHFQQIYIVSPDNSPTSSARSGGSPVEDGTEIELGQEQK